MKIAIFSDTFLPQINGAVTSITNLSQGLADRGHQIHIIAPKFKNMDEINYPGIFIHRTPAVPAFFYEDFKFTSPISRKVFEYIKKEKIDIIHFQTPITLGLQAILIAKYLKIPLIGSFHTFFADPLYLKHIYFNNKFIQKAAWEYINLYFNRCDLVTCPSIITKEELMNNGCKSPVKVISNGINVDIFNNRNSKRIKNKYNPDGNLLLFVGRISHEKNIPFLLKSFELILKELKNTKLMIVGNGPQFKSIQSKVNSLDLQDNVIFTGNIKYDALAKSGIYGACDLFVTASGTETQGLSVLEALANDLVCVGVNSGAVPEVIKNNETGFIVQHDDIQGFADSVIKLLTNNNLYKRFQRNSKEILKIHDMKRTLNRWEETYIDLIEKTRKDIS